MQTQTEKGKNKFELWSHQIKYTHTIKRQGKHLPCDSTVQGEGEQQSGCTRHRILVNNLQKDGSQYKISFPMSKCECSKSNNRSITFGFPRNSMVFALILTMPESKYPSRRAFWMTRSNMLTNNSNSLYLKAGVIIAQCKPKYPSRKKQRELPKLDWKNYYKPVLDIRW